MNRFEKLFQDLGSKMESIRGLCSDLIKFTGADKAFNDLETVVGILRNPDGKVNKHTTGFVAARAEEMLDTLDKYERRFLISLSSIDAVRARIGVLHEETQLRAKASDAITVYDILRVNPKTTVSALREAYLEMNGLMVRAEAQSRKLYQRDFHKVVNSEKKSRRQQAA